MSGAMQQVIIQTNSVRQVEEPDHRYTANTKQCYSCQVLKKYNNQFLTNMKKIYKHIDIYEWDIYTALGHYCLRIKSLK